MNKFKSIFAIVISVALFSCTKDDDKPSTPTPLTVQTFSDLYAPSGGVPPATTGDFIKFSFKTNAIVTGDNWDVAFRSTTILVNGGVAASGQPTRTGIGAGAVLTSTFSGILTAPSDNLLLQDSATTYAIPIGSNNGWYNYNGATNVVSPIAGKVIVVKTHDGKYAKMEILSYYKDAPVSPTGTEPSRYYKFNFVYQPDGSKNF